MDRKDFENKLILGNSLEVLETMPDCSVDLVLTDPPYIMKLTKNSGAGGCIAQSKNYVKKFIDSDKKTIIEDWDMGKYFEQFTRVCNPFQGYFFCSVHQLPELLNIAVNHGFIFSVLVWYKYNAAPLASTNWLPDMEYIVHMRKHGTYFKGKAKDKAKLFRVSSQKPKYGHPTEKPEAIIQRLIKVSAPAGALVLDPFLGSGTSAAVAAGMGRKYTGIEIEKEYLEAAKKRVYKAEIQNRFLAGKEVYKAEQKKLF